VIERNTGNIAPVMRMAARIAKAVASRPNHCTASTRIPY
jgi:hypothetical protein